MTTAEKALMAAEDKGSEGTSVQNVRAVTRALAVLSSFAGKGPQSLAQVTNATGLDKGTTRRLLLTLIGSGFVMQDPATQLYRLGRAIRELAANVQDNFDLRTIAQPILTKLASEMHLTAFLSVYQEGDAVCLDRVHDMRGIEVHWWAVGGTMPLNCGGAPKLFLAYQPRAEIKRVLSRPLEAMSPKTITDPVELEKRLTLIRKRGWECAIDDVALGLTALAVPVRGGDGMPICAISVAGLTPQMVVRGKPIQLERLQADARALERQLGVDLPPAG